MPNTEHRRRGEGRSYLLPGGNVHTVLLSGPESNGHLAVLEVRCPPGGGPPPHSEPTDAFFRVLEGEIEFSLERDGKIETVALLPGDSAFVPAGAGHGFRNRSEVLGRLLVVGQPAGLEEFIADCGVLIDDAENPPEAPEIVDRDAMEEIFERHGVLAFQAESAVWES